MGSVTGSVIGHEAQDRHHWTIGGTVKTLPRPKAGFARREMGMCTSSKCAQAEPGGGSDRKGTNVTGNRGPWSRFRGCHGFS